MDTTPTDQPLLEGVAIVGVAGRFPGARDVAEFWRNQLAGLEKVSHFTVDELEIADKAAVADNSAYVRSRSVLPDVELFDAEFFGIMAREAAVMDPQQRLFLEVCWEALEDAGYDPARTNGTVGVYGGCSVPTYLLSRLCQQPGFIERFTEDYQVGSFQELIGNGSDFFATRVAYKLDLRGPAMTVQTACSTSLVAVAQAAQALMTYQCDLALAGGVSISFPQKRGTYFLEGGMTSPDGHCRTFDAAANGTVFGSGGAVVLLKRVEDAVRDGDQIYAVIKGFGLSNDGSEKVGYTAPSVTGQAQAINSALGLAGVEPDSIGYIEAHGTGTPLGDPIELAALAQVFNAATERKQFCTIGTAKTNIGHLDVAAGVTGLIHAAHVVRHGKLPPTLHFTAPNPKFDLVRSPFKVNTALADWPRGHGPRRAGVSAFGVGGTNCHVVIEEAPQRQPIVRREVGPHVLVLSARSERALAAMAERLADRLESDPDLDLADIAFTLQTGRRRFAFAATYLVAERAQAIAALRGQAPELVQARSAPLDGAKVTFLFPGQGTQHVGMGQGLYRRNAVFRTTIDACADGLRPSLAVDLRAVLYPAVDDVAAAQALLTETQYAQPALFALEIALARMWQSQGVTPQVMVGHSVGEFAAACVAGVFSLEDGLAMIAARGRLMQAVVPGAMLSVRLRQADLVSRLVGTTISLAAVNAPEVNVAAGTVVEIDGLEAALKRDGIKCRRLITSHAFHSAMMDGVLEPFRAVVAQVKFSPPKIPIISTVSGLTLSATDACDPEYWVRHLRETVNYSGAVAGLRTDPRSLLLEVGSGNTLGTLALQHDGVDQTIAASLPGPQSDESDVDVVLQGLGALWLAGCPIDWSAVHGEHSSERRRVSLPTYPFQRKHYAIEVPTSATGRAPAPVAMPLAQTVPVMSEPAAMSLPSVSTAPVAATIIVSQSGPDRHGRIQARLIQVLEELSGAKLTELPPGTTFLEMGFDSLFLTQVTRELKRSLALKVTFRQLLSEHNSLAKLTAYAAAALPVTAFADEPSSTAAPASVTPVALQAEPMSQPSSATASPLQIVQMPPQIASSSQHGRPLTGEAGSSAERLMRDQLQVMSAIFTAQISALSGHPSAASQPLPVAVLPPVAPLRVPDPAIAATLALVPRALPAPTAAPEAQTDTKEFKAFGPYKPIQAKMAVALSTEQRRSIAALAERYSRRHAKSKALTQAYRKVLADPRVVSGFREDWKEMIFPVTVNRSQGSKLWDVDGNELIDILNGFGPVMFGHRPDFIETAVAQQLHDGFEVGPQTPLAGEVAELFCEITGNERMTFCNTGSEAVMAAMRIARTVTGRDKILMFTGDYHGMFDEVLVKAARTKLGESAAAPIAPGIPPESVSNVVVLDYGTPDTLDWLRANVDQLAAVIVEPVQSRRPSFRPVAFLQEVRALTAASGTALVFDEVVTGFRTHPGGCQALFNIRADMATYGKVAGGGMPIGILAGRAEFMDALDGGPWRFGDASVPEVGVTFFAGTFVRHPLALAGMRAILGRIKAEGPALQERLGQRTDAMLVRINAVLERYAIPTRLANFTSFFFFNFPPEERLASLFYATLRMHGVHVLEGFPCFLTTAHSDADIDHIVGAFEAAALDMRRHGFLLTPLPVGFVLPEVRAVAGVEDASTEVPLTAPQRELFLAAMMGDDASCAFNESFSVHLSRPVDSGALEAALGDLMRRHEALRGIVSRDGERLIIGATTERMPIARLDLTALSLEAVDARYHDALAADARTPFQLHTGPLVRAILVARPQDRTTLVLSAHHIVCDGWSVNVILEDLARLYSIHTGATGLTLAPVVSFSDYARQQVGFATSVDQVRNEAYWTNQFKVLPAPLDLPVDRPRGTYRTFNGSTLRDRIGADDYKAIKAFGSRHGVSLFATLLAGFTALVGRVAQQDDVVVGIPMAGQQDVEDGVLVGHCVNFLPLRLPVHRDGRFVDLMAQVRDTVLDAHEHQNYTYGTLIERLGMRRDPVRLPLTELQFNVEQIGASTPFQGLQSKVEPNPKSAVNSDLFINVVEQADGLSIDCDYNTDLYDAATIRGWVAALRSILLSAVAAPETAIGALALPVGTKTAGAGVVTVASLGDVEHVLAWNATDSVYPRDASIQALFEAQVALSPDSVALVLGEHRLTYGELNNRANHVARELVAAGVKEGDRVACCLQRSFELVTGILAIVKAGCAYVPLDPALPGERLDFILSDTNARVLLSTSFVPLPDLGLRRIDIDRADARSQQVVGNLPATSHAGSLAYIMYTSGSTGRPKGVMIEHRSVVRLVRDTNYCTFGPQTAFLVNAPISFDASTFEIWGPLLNGGRAVLMPAGDPSLADLGRVIRDHGVTTAFFTTGLFHVLVEQHLTDLGQLKQLFTGGEVLVPAHMQRVLDACPATQLVAVYGPTEGTTYTTFHPFASGTRVPASVPIGKPISNSRTYILGEDLLPLAIGSVGELFVAGDGLARGYLNLPTETAQRFIEKAVGGRIERLYRTGDLARQLSDGTLEFHGRLDGQIKLRGFRIETGEIEAAFQLHPGVKQACVLPEIEHGRTTRLIAFYVATNGKPIDDGVLRQHVQNKLPSFMVPSAIVPVPELPLNVNGKIDRAKLLDIERSRRVAAAFSPPETADEKTLCDIVVEVMQLPRVGITDNLFELGVDSLKIFQITSRASKAGLGITPRMILQARTVKDTLAEAAKAPVGPTLTRVNIKPVARQRQAVDTLSSKRVS
jgi:amino acid adenylation domain-containing protein